MNFEKNSAFIAGEPVQPVLLRYSGAFDLAFESIPTPIYLLRLFGMLSWTVHIDVLPIYWPSDEERLDANLYAANVRQYMADFGHLALSDSDLNVKRELHERIRAGEFHWERSPVN